VLRNLGSITGRSNISSSTVDKGMELYNDDIIEKMHARQRKDLLETDGRKKERRRRKQPSNVQQKSIVGFMSLMAVH
jgi:hypothetical protein